jgi:hypothetical protein
MRRLALVFGLALTTAAASAGEPEIVTDLTAFFRTTEPAERARLATRIAADPGFHRERLGALLHQMPLWMPVAPGRHPIRMIYVAYLGADWHDTSRPPSIRANRHARQS